MVLCLYVNVVFYIHTAATIETFTTRTDWHQRSTIYTWVHRPLSQARTEDNQGQSGHCPPSPTSCPCLPLNVPPSIGLVYRCDDICDVVKVRLLPLSIFFQFEISHWFGLTYGSQSLKLFITAERVRTTQRWLTGESVRESPHVLVLAMPALSVGGVLVRTTRVLATPSRARDPFELSS